MLGRRRQELEERAKKLEAQQEHAERQRMEVASRGSFIERVSKVVAQYHEENHVTESFLTMFGTGRR